MGTYPDDVSAVPADAGLARYLEKVKKAIPRRCEDCKQPVTLEQGYYFNFVTGQYWHRACQVDRR